MVARSLLALGLAALSLAACDRLRPETGVVLRTDDPQLLARGQAIYRAQCASCHGAHLEGQPNWRERDAAGRLPAPPHDASGHTWHHPDQVLFDIVKNGVAQAAHLKDYQTAMPVFGGTLSDADIVAVLSWIKSQWPEGVRAKQEKIDQAARQEARR